MKATLVILLLLAMHHQTQASGQGSSNPPRVWQSDLTSSLPTKAPAGVSDSEWIKIRSAHSTWSHGFTKTANGWQASNPGQQWFTTFDKRGFVTSPNEENWNWGLTLESYGLGSRQIQVAGEPVTRAEGQKLSYQWDNNIQEWWINDERGLEHGYVIRERPFSPLDSTNTVLTLVINTRGGLVPKLTSDALGVIFSDESAKAIVNYTGLKVIDADGITLTSRFEPAGGKSFRLIVDDRAARYPITIDPIAQQAYVKIGSSTTGLTNFNDRMGWSVAIDGDTMVVGAPFEDSSSKGINSSPNENSRDAGAVFVFVRTGSTWSQQAYIKPTSVGVTQADDFFGTSVDIFGDTLAVGAPGEASSTRGINTAANENASGAGAVYIFVRSGTTWSQQAYIKPAEVGTTQVGDGFGASVAIDVDTLLVGAPGEDSNTTGINSSPNETAAESGAAYVFVRSGTDWSQQALLKPSAYGITQVGDTFGSAVALHADTAVIGAPSEDSSTLGVDSSPNETAANSGSVYVYLRTGSDWAQQSFIKPTAVGSTQVGDGFGTAVGVDGDTLVVGAPFEDSNSTGIDSTANENAAGAGAAYVYVRNSAVWTAQAYLKPSAIGFTQVGDSFGRSVAVSEDTIAIGAPGESGRSTGVNSTPNDLAAGAGAAYIFERAGLNWTQQGYLKPSGVGLTQAGDQLGWSIAVSSYTVCAGAPGEDSNTKGINSSPNESASDPGASYIFTTRSLPSATTGTADTIAFDGATLRGTVLTNGLDCNVFFDYGLTPSYGTTAIATPATIPGSNTVITNVEAILSGLPAHTLFYYRLRVVCSLGTSFGSAKTFRSLNRLPVAVPETSVLALPSAKVSIPVLANDSDPDGDTLSIVSFTSPGNSVGTVSKSGSMLTFVPSASFNGGTFNYTIKDGFGGTATTSVTLQLGSCVLGPDAVVPSDSPSYSLTITADAPWSVRGVPSWARVSATSGNGNGVIQISPLPNASVSSRTAIFTIGGQPHVLTQNGVSGLPVLTVPVPLPNAAISAKFDLPIPTANGPVTYKSTGLPPGMTLSNSTGRLSGYPSVAGTYDVSITAKNVLGSSNTINFQINVLPFPASMAGAYSASVEDSALTDLMGGIVTFDVTRSGMVTGNLKLGTGSYPFSARLNTAVNPLSPDPDHALLMTTVKRPGKNSVILAITMNTHPTAIDPTDLVSGSVTLPGAPPSTAIVSGGRHVWVSSSNSASNFEGYFTTALQPAVPLTSSVPQGDGFLTFTIASSGNVTWSGQLSDGAIVTPRSSKLWKSGEFPVFVLLYNKKGSLNQTLSVSPMVKSVSGSPHWRKQTQASSVRAYASEFSTVLSAVGAFYTPPVIGNTLLNLAAPASVTIEFADGGIESVAQFADLDQAFTVDSSHKATFSSSLVTNPAGVKLTTLNVAKGTFTSTMTLLDPNPFNVALPQIKRTVTAQGVLLPTIGGGTGTGYFLLSSIGGPPANTTTSPQTSGNVTIHP